MAYGWEGAKVRLVPLDRERHFENCVRWLNDPVVTAWTEVGDTPLTRVQEQEFFERASRPGDTDIVFAIELLAEDAEHIGVCGLHAISYRHGTANPGLIIGRPQLWNRGLGSDAARVLARYAFEVVGLRLLLAPVMSENIGSLRAHLKCGYREVGRIPGRYWKRGAYRDVVLLALLRSAAAP